MTFKYNNALYHTDQTNINVLYMYIQTCKCQKFILNSVHTAMCGVYDYYGNTLML